MASMYGHKFITNFGTSDDGTWLAGLQGFDKKQLATGLAACLKRSDPWPPTLPEFRALCRAQPRTMGDKLPALPKRHDRKKALKHIKKIKKILKMSGEQKKDD